MIEHEFMAGESVSSRGMFADNPRRRSRFTLYLFGGCFTFLLLLIVLVSGLVFYAVSTYKRELQKYTAAEARPLPIADVDEKDLQQINETLQEIKSELTDGPTQQKLLLSADDLNAILLQFPETKGRVHVELIDNLIHAQVSLPIDFIPGAKGRYFNGVVLLKPKQTQTVEFEIVSVSANGQPLPQNIMDRVQSADLNKVFRDPRFAFLKIFDHAEIVDNQLELSTTKSHVDLQSLSLEIRDPEPRENAEQDPIEPSALP